MPMIRLDYIEIDKEQIPDTPQRGKPMALERALVLLMLEPERAYAPIDLAKRLYSETSFNTGESATARDLSNARRSYADLALNAGFGKNPSLSGAQWSSLLQSGLRGVVPLMDELKARMSAEPGARFALKDGRIERLEEQDGVHGPDPLDQAADPMLEETSRAETTRDHAEPTPAQRTRRVWGLFSPLMARRPVLGKMVGLLILCLLPLVLGSYSTEVNEVSLETISEMGRPFNESPYFIADGKRYEIGDTVRIEDEVGQITDINRDSIWVNHSEFLSPPLMFFDTEMDVDGNFVVYPGSPRHIAGNFWLSHSRDLDAIKPGTISWLGGYWHYMREVKGSVVMGSWAQMTGRKIICHGDHLMVVQQKYQLDEFLERLGREGAKIIYEEGQIEVFLP